MKRIKIKRDLSTKENREYWAFLEKVAKEVDKWPEWMKGGKSVRTVNEPSDD